MCTMMVCDHLNQINCLFFSLNHHNYMIGLSAIAHKFAGEQTGRQNFINIVVCNNTHDWRAIKLALKVQTISNYGDQTKI